MVQEVFRRGLSTKPRCLGWLEIFTSFSKMALALTLPMVLSMILWLKLKLTLSISKPQVVALSVNLPMMSVPCTSGRRRKEREDEVSRLEELERAGNPDYLNVVCRNPGCNAKKPRLRNRQIGWDTCFHKGCTFQSCGKDACKNLLGVHQGSNLSQEEEASRDTSISTNYQYQYFST